MGFSGGGSNVLLPHTHDGTVSQDGGPLNFNNITQSQSAAGEIFYSDGVHLQQLVYPAVPAGETLTAAAASTSPSWAPSGGAGSFTIDGFASSAAGAASLQVSGMTGRDITQILFSVGVNATTTAYPMIRVSGISTNNYKVRNMNNATEFTDTAATGYILDESTGSNLDKQYQGEMYIFKGNSNLSFTGNVMKSIVGSLNTSAATIQTHYTTQGSGNQNSTADITQIDLLLSAGNIYGTMQVNSMNYQ